MRKSTKLLVFGAIMVSFILSDINGYTSYSNPVLFSGDTNKTGRLPAYPSGSADSIQNQGDGNSAKPKETNTYDIAQDSNSIRKEVPIGNPPTREVPVGDPPMGKDSMDIIKSKELPVITNDNSVIEAQPAVKVKQ